MPKASVRLELRLEPGEKERITHAASLRGMAVAAFARDAVLREADTAIAADTTVMLSPEASRRFLDALDARFNPNGRLRKAMDAALHITQR
jgi:uncharacterized protein (DUF1778 family)